MFRGCCLIIQERKAKNAENRKRYRERIKEKRNKGEFVKSKTNPNVFVRGLPENLLEEELAEFFRKAGALKIDPDTGKPKLKIYRNPDSGACTGEALVSYVKEASVDVAVRYLNNSPFRGCECFIKVEKATFDPSKSRPASGRKLFDPEAARQKILAARLEERRLLSWNEGITNKQMRIMILRPLWTQEEALHYPSKNSFYWDIAQKVKASLSEWITVKSVTPIQRHPYGIVCVKFNTVEDCEAAITQLNETEFRVLEMPLREEDVLFQQFKSWETQRATRALYKGTTVEFNPPDAHQMDLLKRLDIFLLLEARNATLQKDQGPVSTMRTSDHTTYEELAAKFQKCKSLMTRRRHLLEFIIEKPLLLEAYTYDGKGNLRGQALPEIELISDEKSNIEKEKQPGSEDWEVRKCVIYNGVDAEVASQNKFLKGDDSDDEDLVIHTENTGTIPTTE